ncbi:MAG: hypothetical protein LBR76_08835 [Oscillospiraceae bacterium]|nr:hypothetical protein [Oscillospiraceae bacterium]
MARVRRIILRIVGFLLVFTFAEAVLCIVLMPDNLPSRMMMEDMAEMAMRNELDRENIDVAVVGSSAAMTAVDPFLLEELLGENSFNACSSLQQPIASYYLTQDILRLHTPKTVIVSANYSAFGTETLDELQSNLIVFDYMKGSPVKLRFFLDAFQPADYPTVFLKSYHYRSSFSPGKLSPSYIYAKANEPRNPVIHESATYMGKGFTAYTSVWDDSEPVLYHEPPTPDPEKEEYLRKLIALCRERGIDVVLLATPHVQARVEVCPDYFERANAFFSGIAEDCGASFIDLNLAKPELLPMGSEHFKDPSHVNATGAALVTEALASAMRGNGVFYQNVQERLDAINDSDKNVR